MLDVDRAVVEVGADDEGQAELGVVRLRVGEIRASDQALDQRGDRRGDRGDVVGGEAVLLHQPADAVDRAVGQAAGGEGLVRHDVDLELRGELGDAVLDVEIVALVEPEIAVLPGEDVAGAEEARRRQRSQEVSAARELKPTCIPRSGEPSTCDCMVPLVWLILVAEGPGQGVGVEALELADGGGGAEAAGRGGPEEADRAVGGLAEEDRDVDAEHHRGEEVRAGDRAAGGRAPLAMGEERGEDGCERMQDGVLVDAVEFEAVDLVAVHEGGGAGRQALAADPDGGLVAGAPARGHLDDLVDAEAGAAGDADPERVEQEGLGLVDAIGVEIAIAGGDDALDEPGHGISLHRGRHLFGVQAEGRSRQLGRAWRGTSTMAASKGGSA